MHSHLKVFAGVLATTLLAPISVQAQFIATPYHTFEVRSPNSLGFRAGPRVYLGANGPNGIFGTATRSDAESCEGPLSLQLDNQVAFNIPNQSLGIYFPTSFGGICTGSWRLAMQVGTEQAIVYSQELVGATLIPFVSNVTLASSADGKVHTFNWSAVPGAKSVTVQVWDRSLMPAQPPQLVSGQGFSGTTTNFVIDLNRPGHYVNGRAYTLDVWQNEDRDNGIPPGAFQNALSRSRTYFDFILPSAPLTTAPVHLPIVEYVAGDPTYTFTVTVDGTSTFVIDPDIAVGYIYQTAAGNPNFRSVALPDVGDGRYLIEIFDPSTGLYGRSFTARAGKTYAFATYGYRQGVTQFRVTGIETSAGLDAANPSAFPTAIGFTGAGTFTGSMVPMTRHNFSGFLPPINLPPTTNTSHAGRRFPFKWTLADVQGKAVTNLGAVDSITYKPSTCAPFTTDPAGASPASDTGHSKLRYNARTNQYVFNWKSPKQPGCYVLFLKLDTGQVFSANLLLSKGSNHNRDEDRDDED